MPLAALILVETSHAGNLGSAIRVAANFGVPRIELVRPAIDPDSIEVARWACGGDDRVVIDRHSSFEEAAAPFRTLIASASGRGRHNQPLISPREALPELERRGLGDAALAFGNETSGLRRSDIDRCDLVIRVPTVAEFPVLNLTQAIAILLGYFSMEVEAPETTGPVPASQDIVDALMGHLDRSLSAIGFLDPSSPQRILRKLRRLFGRAGITDNEVAILRGICRQMEWAARAGPLSTNVGRSASMKDQGQP
jgi:TrmH family RNA methyltransferase